MAASAGNAPDEALGVEARGENLLAVRFTAMASPCEVLLSSTDRDAALEMGTLAAREAQRVERKFSRYRNDSVTAWIHENRGSRIEVDEETASLIDFASRCFELSDGLFDITSGVLRRAWRFDASGHVPEAAQVERLLPLVGFARLQLGTDGIALPMGMEIDLGGIAKEYAVDRALAAIESASARSAIAHEPLSVLVNFGGDLRSNAPPAAKPWQVAIEDPERGPEPPVVLELTRGALATSGDAHRFVLRDGRRYGHILDPRSGWPVEGAPRSVTVAAATCIEAGSLSTIAMLRGRDAESFLEECGARYWCVRGR